MCRVFDAGCVRSSSVCRGSHLLVVNPCQRVFRVGCIPACWGVNNPRHFSAVYNSLYRIVDGCFDVTTLLRSKNQNIFITNHVGLPAGSTSMWFAGGLPMFLNEKACRIIIAIKNQGEANISRIARLANANIGHTSNTILRAQLSGYVEQYKRNRETMVRLTRTGKEIAELIEQALNKLQQAEKQVDS